MCTCEPFKCERFCFNADHEKMPYKVGEEWDHCITFDCDGCALEIIYHKFQVNYYRIQTIYVKYIIALTSYLYCYMHMLDLAKEKIIQIFYYLMEEAVAAIGIKIIYNNE